MKYFAKIYALLLLTIVTLSSVSVYAESNANCLAKSTPPQSFYEFILGIYQKTSSMETEDIRKAAFEEYSKIGNPGGPTYMWSIMDKALLQQFMVDTKILSEDFFNESFGIPNNQDIPEEEAIAISENILIDIYRLEKDKMGGFSIDTYFVTASRSYEMIFPVWQVIFTPPLDTPQFPYESYTVFIQAVSGQVLQVLTPRDGVG